MVINGVVSFLNNLKSHISASSSEAIIFDIAIIFVISAIFAIIARMLKQPFIPAYVIAGLIIGPIFLGLVTNSELILSISKLEIIFLIFIAGLEISFRKIKEAGLKRIIVIGVLQSLIVLFVTVLLSSFFGLNNLQAYLIGSAIAFSSTLVCVKVLMEKNELVTLHGRITIGVLLLQDFLAIFAITIITSSNISSSIVLYSVLKIIVLVILAILCHMFIERLFRFTSKSSELLFLSTIALLFFFVIVSFALDVSMVVGAFLAGIILANSAFKTDLESRMYPLGEFFSILFFVALGTQITFDGVSSQTGLFIFILLMTILFKPVLLFLLSRVFGYRASTSFNVGISLGQMSEFSIVLGLIGLTAGIIDSSLFSLIILSTVLSMAISPYLIGYKSKIYLLFRKPAKWFDFIAVNEKLGYNGENDKEVALIGSHRMGAILLKNLEESKKKLVVVDFNPVIINALTAKKISCIYGDIASPDILNKILSKKLKMVISTVPGFDENINLLKKIKEFNPKSIVIVTAGRISDSLNLYENGADYVITPKILAGEQVLSMINSSKSSLKEAKRKHMNILNNIHKVLY